MFFNRRKSKKESSGVFVRKADKYEELINEVTKESINAITEYLGYNTDQVHTVHAFDEKDLEVVVVEIFSKNIVYVLTEKTVPELNKRRMDKFLKSVDWGIEFDSFTTEDILDSGIENHSLTSKYLSKILGIENSDEGVLFTEELGLHLVFTDGYLIDYQSSDGLNKSAKLLKGLNFKLLEGYCNEALKYHKEDNASAMNEVNIQADCFTATPHAYSNEFIHLHISELGNVNFYNLMIAHYNKQVNIKEFKNINKGRYKESIGIDSTNLIIGDFEYEFNEKGLLIVKKDHS